MKKIITFFLIIFAATNIYAQNRPIDSLKLLLAKEKKDTGKIKLLINICSTFAYSMISSKGKDLVTLSYS